MSTKIEGAQVILEDDIVTTDVLIESDKIVEVGGSSSADVIIDGRGKILAPAMVDIHGDAFERQMMPRPKVFFPMDAALLETDRQLASNGIATAYHALTPSWESGLRSVERGEAFLAGLSTLEERFTIENRVQLRWETFAFEAVDLIGRALRGPHLPSIAFNDHTSMTMRDFDTPVQERLFEQNPDFTVVDTTDPRFITRTAKLAERSGLDQSEYAEKLQSIWQRRAQVPEAIQQVAEMARSNGAPMLTHDDSQQETRDYYRALGARISEFPMRVAVAETARQAGDSIVFGSPNVMRGGSHIGSPSAADMVEQGLCDILASDYFYPAMLAAVARLEQEKRAPLPKLWSLVSKGPAHASGLHDRGEIAVGKRADLILIDWPQGATPAVKLTLSAGRVAYRAEG